ncbi:unnamed protein product [Trifolium pratense]|uniref:Uncharacterized protein n=1 Tax=Trifolium pratense TaxID=57577 RepID=A0ACB0K5X2_TRIPR|nr:unnamed protein product [Trifolium pratense]
MTTAPDETVKKYHELIHIKHGIDKVEYQLRVLKKWNVLDVSKHGRIHSVDMILIDKNGHKIQASIPGLLCCMFDELIVEGYVYVMSNFFVQYNEGKTMASYHKNLFVFNVNIEVKLSWSSKVPRFGTSLIGSENVLDLSERFKYLVDVIGVVTYIRHDKNYFDDGSASKTVAFKLTDHRLVVLRIPY